MTAKIKTETRFTREDVAIAQSTLDGWSSRAMDPPENSLGSLADDTKPWDIFRSTSHRLKYWNVSKKGLPSGIILGLLPSG
jgi:hypothetical protein